MKIKISNLGPIKRADFALNDFTILVGSNNSGKTYITYSVFGILDHFASRDQGLIERLLFRQKSKFEIRNEGENYSVKIPLSEIKGIFDRDNPHYFEENFEDFLRLLFNDKGSDLVQQKSMITPTLEKNDITIFSSGFEKRSKGKFAVEIKDDYIELKTNLPSPLPQEILDRESLYWLSRSIQIRFNYKPYLLTAERLGIALFYKELDTARNSIIQALQAAGSDKRNEIDIQQLLRRSSSYYAYPIKKNIDYTRGIDETHSQRSTFEISHSLKIFEELASGTFAKLPEQEIHFQSKTKGNNFDIPLYLASSSARALSDLFFFVKNFASPGSLLMIDEPESHLTLDKQRIMARFLVSLVNSGVKVWITTHSDFLVKEVNLLIRLSNKKLRDNFLKEKKNGAYSDKDYLLPKRLSIFTLGSGEVKSLEVTEKGISNTYFDDSIQNLNDDLALLDYLEND